MDAQLYKIAGQHSFAINSNEEIYKRGRSYDITKKMEVAAALQATQHPNVTSVSKQCKVSRTFVSKIVTKLVEHGKLLPPDQKRWHTKSGPGAKKFDEIDAFVVLILYMKQPSRGLHTYALWLEHFTGSQVSESFPIFRVDCTTQTLFLMTIFSPRIVSEQSITFKYLPRSIPIVSSLEMRRV